MPKMSLVPTAWMTAPAARKSSALNTPWVSRCRKPALANPAPIAPLFTLGMWGNGTSNLARLIINYKY